MDVVRLREELIRDEGTVRVGGRHIAYKDRLGFWTLAYGRLVDGARGGGLTEEEAIYLLDNDIGRVLTELRRRIPFWDKLSPVRQRALANMGFQLGVNGLMNFRKMLEAMAIGHFDRAKLEALDSKWARQTPARAQRISEMIRHG